VEILQQASPSLGRTPTVLITSWSPPASLKANGQENCSGSSNCTLRRDGGQATIVILNVGSSDRSVAIDPDGFSTSGAQAYRTVYRPDS
jgi:hypothetical protein